MDRPEYIQLLTIEERAQCMKLGAATRMASLAKSAEGGALSFLSPSNVARAIIGVSLLAGVPIGIAAHTVSNRITDQSTKERDLIEKAKQYRSAAKTLGQGLRV